MDTCVLEYAFLLQVPNQAQFSQRHPTTEIPLKREMEECDDSVDIIIHKIESNVVVML
jgi:hypothetical protein